MLTFVLPTGIARDVNYMYAGDYKRLKHLTGINGIEVDVLIIPRIRYTDEEADRSIMFIQSLCQ